MYLKANPNSTPDSWIVKMQYYFRIWINLPDQGRQFAGDAVDSHVAGELYLVISADGFDDLRESAPGFFGGLQIIAFVQTALNVLPVMGQVRAVGFRVDRRVFPGQRRVPARGKGGADSGNNLLIGEGRLWRVHGMISGR